MGFAVGFLLGGALGASLALLVAPEPGRQTRERLRDVAADVRDKTMAGSDELRDKAEAVLERSREVFDETKATLSAAVQAGKAASQRERARHGPRRAVPLQRDAGHVQAETPTGGMRTGFQGVVNGDTLQGDSSWPCTRSN